MNDIFDQNGHHLHSAIALVS